jgi:hypothetical protein
MKRMRLTPFVLPVLTVVLVATTIPESIAGPRQRPANPRGVADPRGIADPRGVADPRGIADPRGVRDPRGVADPRGVLDPRGVADPRGVFDPRGPFDPRNPARYMYGLPAGYVARVYGGVRFYYCSGTYYYAYYINGQTVYVKTTVVSGVPKVPPPPF